MHRRQGSSRARPLTTARLGQTMLELAWSLSLLLGVTLGAIEFALYAHAHQVVVSAAQEGSRVASAEGRTLGEGVRQAQALLDIGLGGRADRFTIEPRCAVVSGDICQDSAVAIRISGGYPLQLIGLNALSLPIDIEASMFMERFRTGL